jgi:hypothetical protein
MRDQVDGSNLDDHLAQELSTSSCSAFHDPALEDSAMLACSILLPAILPSPPISFVVIRSSSTGRSIGAPAVNCAVNDHAAADVMLDC